MYGVCVADTIGEQLYQCELCRTVLGSQDLLIHHYQDYHHCALCLDVLQPAPDGHDKDPPGLPQPAPKLSELQVTLVQANRKQELRKTPERRLSGKRGWPAILSSWGRGHRERKKPGRPPKRKPVSSLQHHNGADQVTDDIMMTEGECKLVDVEHYDEDSKPTEDVNIEGLEADGEEAVESCDIKREKEDPAESPPAPNFSFLLVVEVVKGRTVTYERQWLRCIHCEVRTRTKTMLTKHMRETHPEVLAEPPDTLDTADTIRELEQSGLKVDIMDMVTYETVMCSEGKPRRPKGKRPRKLEKQDIPGVYPCSQCGKVFSRLRYLRKHTETHRTEKKFVCDTCGKSFKSRAYLRVHKRIHREKVFRCNQCPFTSSNNASIHIHRQIHSQGSVLCDICGYAYTDKSTLTKHKRVHDTSRPYACNHPGCMWRFKTEIMCKAHIRAHTTEGKFRCAYCGYIFRHKHHLIRHETNIHGVQRDRMPINNNSPPAATLGGGGAHLECVPDSQLESSTVGIVIPEELHLGEGALVVTTDHQGTPITYEATDIATYEALIHPDAHTQVAEDLEETQEILVTPAHEQMQF